MHLVHLLGMELQDWERGWGGGREEGVEGQRYTYVLMYKVVSVHTYVRIYST